MLALTALTANVCLHKSKRFDLLRYPNSNKIQTFFKYARYLGILIEERFGFYSLLFH